MGHFLIDWLIEVVFTVLISAISKVFFLLSFADWRQRKWLHWGGRVEGGPRRGRFQDPAVGGAENDRRHREELQGAHRTGQALVHWVPRRAFTLPYTTLSTLSVHFVCPFCLSTLSVHYVCPFCLSTLSVHYVCPFCLSTLSVHSVCPFCLSILSESIVSSASPISCFVSAVMLQFTLEGCVDDVQEDGQQEGKSKDTRVRVCFLWRKKRRYPLEFSCYLCKINIHVHTASFIFPFYIADDYTFQFRVFNRFGLSLRGKHLQIFEKHEKQNKVVQSVESHTRKYWDCCCSLQWNVGGQRWRNDTFGKILAIFFFDTVDRYQGQSLTGNEITGWISNFYLSIWKRYRDWAQRRTFSKKFSPDWKIYH